MKWILGILVLFSLNFSANAGFDFEKATNQMLIDLNAGDTLNFNRHFFSTVKIHNIGDKGLETLLLNEFTPVLNNFRSKHYQEEFTKIEVNELDNGLTYVDVYFSFFIDGVIAFTGIDHVIWVKDPAKNLEYKIETYYSGALKPKFTTSNGGSTTAGELDALIDQWHRDVAEFKFDDYFGFMGQEFIFLGTDPTERWTKEQFASFCKPFFEKKSTWDFKPKWRNWYFSEDGKTAWFEEQLDTWMEECRASGVLMKIKGEWKIVHYNLTVLIENDKTDKFIKLRNK